MIYKEKQYLMLSLVSLAANLFLGIKGFLFSILECLTGFFTGSHRGGGGGNLPKKPTSARQQWGHLNFLSKQRKFQIFHFDQEIKVFLMKKWL